MKRLYIVAAGYLYLPLLLFVCMWLKIWVAIPVAAITLFALFCGVKRMCRENIQEVLFPWWQLCLVFVGFFLVCILCGQGDLFYQDADWRTHHAILYDLVEYPWPVVYDGDVLLTYYIGQFIVPAFLGKILWHSKVVALWALVIWNALGLTIAYLFLCQYLKTKSTVRKIVVFVVLLLWSGAPNLGTLLYQATGHDVGLCSYKWIDLNRIRVHFAPNLDALRGSFQHVIVPWICGSIFLHHKKSYGIYILLGLPLLFSSTFGFVYFAGIMIVYCVWNLTTEKAWKAGISEIFSRENLLLLPVLGVILVYLGGNVFGEKPDGLGLDLLNMFTRMDFYLIFILVEFVGYFIFLFRENRKNPLYYILLLELMLIPFISLGMFNDLCSRGSIPARFLLMVLCLEQLFRYGFKNWRNLAITLIFCIGACNEVQEVQEILRFTMENGIGSEQVLADSFGTLNGKAAEEGRRIDEAYNYYTLEYSDSWFYHIARNSVSTD